METWWRHVWRAMWQPKGDREAFKAWLDKQPTTNSEDWP